MADQTDRGGRDRDGYGDDQGTRVGRPDDPDRRDDEMQDDSGASSPSQKGLEGSILDDDDESSRGRGSTASGGSRAHDASRSQTGAGGEAAEGLHSTGGREQRARSGMEEVQSSGDDPGSEPIRGRTHEHKGGYGGEKGEPRT
jgi:hypothetical protein